MHISQNNVQDVVWLGHGTLQKVQSFCVRFSQDRPGNQKCLQLALRTLSHHLEEGDHLGHCESCAIEHDSLMSLLPDLGGSSVQERGGLSREFDLYHLPSPEPQSQSRERGGRYQSHSRGKTQSTCCPQWKPTWWGKREVSSLGINHGLGPVNNPDHRNNGGLPASSKEIFLVRISGGCSYHHESGPEFKKLVLPWNLGSYLDILRAQVREDPAEDVRKLVGLQDITDWLTEVILAWLDWIGINLLLNKCVFNQGRQELIDDPIPLTAQTTPTWFKNVCSFQYKYLVWKDLRNHRIQIWGLRNEFFALRQIRR